jgi:hypothetical protein
MLLFILFINIHVQASMTWIYNLPDPTENCEYFRGEGITKEGDVYQASRRSLLDVYRQVVDKYAENTSYSLKMSLLADKNEYDMQLEQTESYPLLNTKGFEIIDYRQEKNMDSTTVYSLVCVNKRDLFTPRETNNNEKGNELKKVKVLIDSSPTDMKIKINDKVVSTPIWVTRKVGDKIDIKFLDRGYEHNHFQYIVEYRDHFAIKNFVGDYKKPKKDSGIVLKNEIDYIIGRTITDPKETAFIPQLIEPYEIKGANFTLLDFGKYKKTESQRLSAINITMLTAYTNYFQAGLMTGYIQYQNGPAKFHFGLSARLVSPISFYKYGPYIRYDNYLSEYQDGDNFGIGVEYRAKKGIFYLENRTTNIHKGMFIGMGFQF